MISKMLAKRKKASASEERMLVKGLDLALTGLREVKRIQSLKIGAKEKTTQIGALAQKLRQKGREDHLPLLAGLAEGLGDALIDSTGDESLSAS